jgi:hypothetical protein
VGRRHRQMTRRRGSDYSILENLRTTDKGTFICSSRFFAESQWFSNAMCRSLWPCALLDQADGFEDSREQYWPESVSHDIVANPLPQSTGIRFGGGSHGSPAKPV